LLTKSAIRELFEEVGIIIKNGNDLKFLGKKLYEDNISSVWSYVYLLNVYEDVSIKFEDGEVESIEWLTLSEICNRILTDKITPDSIDSFNYYINK
jgi:8-oxo-dGTP pyrophosphatase MutT (NUDIX family)